MERLLTTNELCKILQVRRETIHRWRKAGLPYKKPVGAIRYDVEEVKAWLGQHNQNRNTEDMRDGGELHE